MMDTGFNTQESKETLLKQQALLLSGKRHVQMFPKGTIELTLPEGIQRIANFRGTFHYNPKFINYVDILRLSEEGRENEFLCLGPYSKTEVMRRIQDGESIIFITEYDADGIEIRSAVGTSITEPRQRAYFETSKLDGSLIISGDPPERIVKSMSAYKQFLFNRDSDVAKWTFDRFHIRPTSYEMAIGIVDNGELVGSVIWHAYNGNDIEISYYGPKTMTLGIARTCARIAVDYFEVSRVTARTAKNNKAMTRGVRKIGFEYEGIRHNAYGEHDAVMYGLYGRNLARLAGKEMH